MCVLAFYKETGRIKIFWYLKPKEPRQYRYSFSRRKSLMRPIAVFVSPLPPRIPSSSLKVVAFFSCHVHWNHNRRFFCWRNVRYAWLQRFITFRTLKHPSVSLSSILFFKSKKAPYSVARNAIGQLILPAFSNMPGNNRYGILLTFCATLYYITRYSEVWSDDPWSRWNTSLERSTARYSKASRYRILCSYHVLIGILFRGRISCIKW